MLLYLAPSDTMIKRIWDDFLNIWNESKSRASRTCPKLSHRQNILNFGQFGGGGCREEPAAEAAALNLGLSGRDELAAGMETSPISENNRQAKLTLTTTILDKPYCELYGP